MKGSQKSHFEFVTCEKLDIILKVSFTSFYKETPSALHALVDHEGRQGDDKLVEVSPRHDGALLVQRPFSGFRALVEFMNFSENYRTLGNLHKLAEIFAELVKERDYWCFNKLVFPLTVWQNEKILFYQGNEHSENPNCPREEFKPIPVYRYKQGRRKKKILFKALFDKSSISYKSQVLKRVLPNLLNKNKTKPWIITMNVKLSNVLKQLGVLQPPDFFCDHLFVYGNIAIDAVHRWIAIYFSDSNMKNVPNPNNENKRINDRVTVFLLNSDEAWCNLLNKLDPMRLYVEIIKSKTSEKIYYLYIARCLLLKIETIQFIHGETCFHIESINAPNEFYVSETNDSNAVCLVSNSHPLFRQFLKQESTNRLCVKSFPLPRIFGSFRLISLTWGFAVQKRFLFDHDFGHSLQRKPAEIGRVYWWPAKKLNKDKKIILAARVWLSPCCIENDEKNPNNNDTSFSCRPRSALARRMFSLRKKHYLKKNGRKIKRGKLIRFFVKSKFSPSDQTNKSRHIGYEISHYVFMHKRRPKAIYGINFSWLPVCYKAKDEDSVSMMIFYSCGSSPKPLMCEQTVCRYRKTCLHFDLRLPKAFINTLRPRFKGLRSLIFSSQIDREFDEDSVFATKIYP